MLVVAMMLGVALVPGIGNESCYGMWILHPIRAVKGKKVVKTTFVKWSVGSFL